MQKFTKLFNNNKKLSSYKDLLFNYVYKKNDEVEEYNVEEY